ncbi:MAG: VCBS repeat-containing protein, partial [Myxococcaceae bacterium]|nr:VCBS repeat-containing protein [Myxococcaceae bacterium]
TAPANGVPTCNGVSCDFTCAAGFKRCGNTCIASSACCTSADCTTPPGPATCFDAATCGSNNTCAYPPKPGSAVCGSVCCLPVNGTCNGNCSLACATGRGDCDSSRENGCELTTNSLAHCNGCNVACPAPPANASAVCRATGCDFDCNAGYVRVSGACHLAPPKQRYPGSTSFATSNRPRFEWALPAGVTGAQLEVCTTRACTAMRPGFPVTVTGTSHTPTTPLPPGIVYWRVRGANGGGGTPSPLASPVWEFRAPSFSAPAGRSWGAFTDVNGDGLADPLLSTYNGARVYVYHGSASWRTTTPAPATTIVDPTHSNFFGRSLARAGDINGDGFSDIVFADANPGRFTLYFGSAAGIDTTSPQTFTVSSGLGRSIGTAGDVDGDGYGDLIIGGRSVFGVGYQALLYRGSAAGLITTPATTLTSSDSNFGQTSLTAGDLNADGFADVAVASPSTGNVFVYYGSSAGLGTTPVTLSGPAASYFGYAMAAGDFDWDGYTDLVVAGHNVGSELVHIYRGGPNGVTATSFTPLNRPPMSVEFGQDLAAANDINGDGYPDLIITNEARFHVYYSTASGVPLNPSITVMAPVDASVNFGDLLGGPGDIDGDGYADVVATDWSYLQSGTAFEFKGRAHSYMGGAAGLATQAQPPAIDNPQPLGALGFFTH